MNFTIEIFYVCLNDEDEEEKKMQSLNWKCATFNFKIIIYKRNQQMKDI